MELNSKTALTVEQVETRVQELENIPDVAVLEDKQLQEELRE